MQWDHVAHLRAFLCILLTLAKGHLIVSEDTFTPVDLPTQHFIKCLPHCQPGRRPANGNPHQPQPKNTLQISVLLLPAHACLPCFCWGHFPHLKPGMSPPWWTSLVPTPHTGGEWSLRQPHSYVSPCPFATQIFLRCHKCAFLLLGGRNNDFVNHSSFAGLTELPKMSR